MLWELAVLFGLVIANGVLAGAEIAIVGFDKMRLKHLVERRDRRARAIHELRTHPERFFATVQIGITVFGATAGAFGGARFASHFAPILAEVPWIGVHAETVSFVVIVSGLSMLSLIAGELVPKSLALRHSEGYSLFMARPLMFLSAAARPLVWFLTGCSNAVLWIFGDKTTFSESRVSKGELYQLLDEAAEAGSLDPTTSEMAERAIEFSELTAVDVMVPRTRVVAIRLDASGDEVKEITLEHGYSRYPVYREDLDDTAGYVLVKDMLALAWAGQLVVLQDLIRPPYFVTETMPASTLLQNMRQKRIPLAIVVDEHGGTSGIVTVEDLAEELLGETFSETIRPSAQPVKELSDGSMAAPGDATIRELNRKADFELPDTGEWSTVGGFITSLAGRVPRAGDAFTAPSGARLEVEEATERRVVKVRIWPRPPSDSLPPPPDEN
jgi:putative hemolysin